MQSLSAVLARPLGPVLAPAAVEIRLLGSFELRLQGELFTTYRTLRVKTLLAYLAWHLDLPQERGALMDLLWPSKNTTEDMRQTVSRLRRVLDLVGMGDRLVAARQSLCLSTGPGLTTDLAVFRQHLDVWKAHCITRPTCCPTCLQALEQGVALYRGELCQDLPVDYSEELEQWQLISRESLRREVVLAQQALTASQLANGDSLAAEQAVERQLELDPFDEEAVRLFLELLRRRGEVSRAQQFYQHWQHRLRQELGTSPEPATRASAASLQSPWPRTSPETTRHESAVRASPPLLSRLAREALPTLDLRLPRWRSPEEEGLAPRFRTSSRNPSLLQGFGITRTEETSPGASHHRLSPHTLSLAFVSAPPPATEEMLSALPPGPVAHSVGLVVSLAPAPTHAPALMLVPTSTTPGPRSLPRAASPPPIDDCLALLASPDCRLLTVHDALTDGHKAWVEALLRGMAQTISGQTQRMHLPEQSNAQRYRTLVAELLPTLTGRNAITTQDSLALSAERVTFPLPAFAQTSPSRPQELCVLVQHGGDAERLDPLFLLKLLATYPHLRVLNLASRPLRLQVEHQFKLGPPG